jgi:hypothetical protein
MTAQDIIRDQRLPAAAAVEDVHFAENLRWRDCRLWFTDMYGDRLDAFDPATARRNVAGERPASPTSGVRRTSCPRCRRDARAPAPREWPTVGDELATNAFVRALRSGRLVAGVRCTIAGESAELPLSRADYVGRNKAWVGIVTIGEKAIIGGWQVRRG